MTAKGNDILGNGFRQLTINLKPDREGEVVCTLVDAGDTGKFDRNVLYIHGFSDYFFQTEMAAQFHDNGYNFYALDLRKCGRSIRSWQTPCNLYDISDYFEDIDAAISQIRRESAGKLVIVGHSTGALAASMFLHNRPGIGVNALVLNSPFLALNISPVLRKMGLPVASFVAKFFPDIRIKKGLSVNYGYSIAKNRHGEWDFNEEWKPLAVSEVRASWLRAIYRAHRELHRGLSIDCPTLVMRSAKSFKSREWSDEFLRSDAVLDVEDIHKYAPSLGKNVSEIVIDGGMHDLFLSASEIRSTAYRRMFEWLESV